MAGAKKPRGRQREPSSEARERSAADDPDDEAGLIERIRQRAYAIWLEEGQGHGRDREHWEQAAREIEGNRRS